MDIILDIKYNIASKDPETWFKLWLLDDEFKKSVNLQNYINLFVYTKNNIIYFPFNVCFVTFFEGTKVWYKNNQIHCLFEPARVDSMGDQYWYKEGKLHRDGDQPAYIGADGSQEWYKEGKLHREGNKPAVIGNDGNQFWYKNGKQIIVK